MRDHLFNTAKLSYVKGAKPEGCILCGVRDGAPGIPNLEVFRTGHFIVSVNLFPYNPGHLLVFPVRHVEDLAELDDTEAIDLHALTVKILAVLRDEFKPAGFNVGYNLGSHSGASISHLHMQIVPRYANEIGFLEIIGGTKVIVSDPVESMERLRSRLGGR